MRDSKIAHLTLEGVSAVLATEPGRRALLGKIQVLRLVPQWSDVHVTIFTIRGSVVRVISLRKANLREVRRYNDQLS